MNWWQSFFDTHYAQRYLTDINPSHVNFLWDTLQLPVGARVFDQCCGCGRFSQALQLRGLMPVGVDCIAEYVDRAAQLCPRGSFACADALEYVAQPACAGGFNVNTSFGYSPDDGQNRRMLESAYHSLIPGAPFVLETGNFARVLSHFRPLMEEWFTDGTHLQRHSQLNLRAGMVEQEWIFRQADGTTLQRHGQTRILLPREVGQALTASGFELVEMFGDLEGRPFAPDSLRLVWVARRPC
ncbi:hypothetical protein IV102_27625 [bacterium]|nr:hypothetical protein [bacterium]